MLSRKHNCPYLSFLNLVGLDGRAADWLTWAGFIFLLLLMRTDCFGRPSNPQKTKTYTKRVLIGSDVISDGQHKLSLTADLTADGFFDGLRRKELANSQVEFSKDGNQIFDYPKPQGGRACSGGVGPRHIIDEPDEQRRAIFGGAWGEKGADQGEHRPVECLRATLAATVVAPSTPPQSTPSVVGSCNSNLPAVDSSPTRSASLSYSALSRHSSKVGAVCVEALVRICAGGDQ
jgi:hypothetical protein